MKAVEVKDQVRLSARKCLELVLSGVKYRLFRAAITVTIVALATAFLTTMLTESLVARRVAAAIDQQTLPREQFLLISSRLTYPLTETELVDELGELENENPPAAARHADRLKEFQFWGNLSDAEMDELERIASDEARYLMFFEDLGEGELRTLLGKPRGFDIFEVLRDPEGFDRFSKRLKQLALLARLPDGDVEKFRDFLARWQQSEELRKRILDGHRNVVERIGKNLLKTRDSRELLAQTDETLLKELRKYGFQLSAHQLGSVREQAGLSRDADKILLLFHHKRVKQGLEDRCHTKISKLTARMFLKEISSSSGARWVVSVAEDMGQPLELEVDRVRQVARYHLDSLELGEVEAIVEASAGDTGDFLGFSRRTISLLAVSLLVCVVGIANAMLMSVTERFKEIATMKCLGATDGFIMVNFILESCIQGIAGGTIGMLLGLLLGSVRSWGKYGWMAMSHFPHLEAISAGGLAWVLGLVISGLAALYPARIAARLAPMEAMRIE